ncbi:hypothetical protein HanIR_Chr05g0233991 [Helianthus annuus]|nr:hypothetical protein HanIR_Chr05g0233991 [Helianthus annuus]
MFFHISDLISTLLILEENSSLTSNVGLWGGVLFRVTLHIYWASVVCSFITFEALLVILNPLLVHSSLNVSHYWYLIFLTSSLEVRVCVISPTF